jgi:LPXTG-motif cell wall-anchored protein
VVVHHEVAAVPHGAVRTGFGGGQESNAPLGIAGLSLMVGGAGLLPLVRRRVRASGRS